MSMTKDSAWTTQETYQVGGSGCRLAVRVSSVAFAGGTPGRMGGPVRVSLQASEVLGRLLPLSLTMRAIRGVVSNLLSSGLRVAAMPDVIMWGSATIQIQVSQSI